MATGRELLGRPVVAAAGSLGATSPPLAAVVVIVAAAWLATVLAQLTGAAGALHHHALVEDGLPPLVAAALFVEGWLVMLGAMMLPASMPAIRASARGAGVGRPGVVVASFLAVYAFAWTAVGLLAFAGDATLHQLVHTTPWLAERELLVQAGVVGLAGAWQLTPWKRRGLDACRHPDPRLRPSGDLAIGARAGATHALDCLASSGALMLLMFAAGFANLAWMAILAAVMAYEAFGRHGQRVAMFFGLALLLKAGAIAMGASSGI